MGVGVSNWLKQLGLGKYTELFIENDLDLDLVTDLSDGDLEKLGIISMGHRKKLLRAIEVLKTSEESSESRTEKKAPAEGPRSSLSARPSEAERRQLTVMFCDLVGSTALSAQLDPEDLRDVLLAYQEACAEAVARFQGHLAKYIGDGLLVYFGYPQAHEDDARRAVSAGLAIIEGIADLNERLSRNYDTELEVRVGIHTGLVVAGEMGGGETREADAIVGETPNVAARIEALAMPNAVAISAATHALVDGMFQFDELGPQHLKGVSGKITVYSVHGEIETTTRFGVSVERGLTPLVGRREEFGLLVRSWQATCDGRGQAVLIQGEAGIGKSRLIDALLQETVTKVAHTLIVIHASPYHITSPLYPVIQQVKRAMNWQDGEAASIQLEKLEKVLLAQTTFTPAEIVPLFADLLSLPLPPERYPALTLTSKEKRDATLDALGAWILELAEERPLLLLWEDLQWADPSTIELMGLILDQVPTAQLLMIGTFRPEFSPPWSFRSHVTPITLARLEPPEVKAIATHLARGKSLPSTVLEHVVAKSDGVPLYVEELTRGILESNVLREEAQEYVLSGSLKAMQIPGTLRDSLMARLDREPVMRKVAQIGAVVGREFSHEILEATETIEEAMLLEGLEQLAASEIVFRRGRGRRSRYVFKHALIQEAAYRSLLRRTRQQYHGKIAQILEERFSGITANNPELVAHHYAQSGEHFAEAAEYWRKAAELALARSANMEAVSHLTAAIECLGRLEASSARHQLELDLQTKLGPAIVATRGFGDPQVRQCYERAQELCDELGDTRKLALILRGQQLSEMVVGDVERARALAEQLAEVTERQDDPALLVGGYHARSQTNVLLGRLREGSEYAEKGMALFKREPHRVDGWPGGQPGEQCYVYGAFARWLLGEPDSAFNLVRTGLEMLRCSGEQFSLANLLALGAVVPTWRGDLSTVRRWSEESADMCQEHQIEYWQRFAECLHSWVEAKESPSPTGVKNIDRAVARYEAVGSRGGSAAIALALLCECCVDAGEVERGLVVADCGLDRAKNNNVRFLESEFHRLRGELLMFGRLKRLEDAESSLQRSLEIARHQEARSLELRTLETLARLRTHHGNEDEGRAMLAACYGEFREGFETGDLRRARVLLNNSS